MTNAKVIEIFNDTFDKYKKDNLKLTGDTMS